MIDGDLEEEMQELSSAEDFFEFFDLDYEPSVVKVNRLHILQRFHDYMAEQDAPEDEGERKALYQLLLAKAYSDFVEGDALTERVFKVLQDAVKPQGFVSMGEIKVKKD